MSPYHQKLKPWHNPDTCSTVASGLKGVSALALAKLGKSHAKPFSRLVGITLCRHIIERGTQGESRAVATELLALVAEELTPQWPYLTGQIIRLYKNCPPKTKLHIWFLQPHRTAKSMVQTVLSVFGGAMHRGARADTWVPPSRTQGLCCWELR